MHNALLVLTDNCSIDRFIGEMQAQAVNAFNNHMLPDVWRFSYAQADDGSVILTNHEVRLKSKWHVDARDCQSLNCCFFIPR